VGRYLDLLRMAGSNEINELIPAAPIISFNSLPRPTLDDDRGRSLAVLDARCPKQVHDSKRWRQAVDDGREFLAEWGDQAKALGWSADDLFALHPTAPLARYDAMGLVWLLRGRRVVALTEKTATIRTLTGTLTHYRHNKPALGPLGDTLDDLDPVGWR
jgi:hypothetical protein